MMESSIALGSSSALTHLVTYSIATKIYAFWFDHGLIEPTKSSAQCLNSLMTSFWFKGISSNCPGRPALWQLSQA